MQNNLEVIELQTKRSRDHILVNHAGRQLTIQLDLLTGTVALEDLESLIFGLEVARSEMRSRVHIPPRPTDTQLELAAIEREERQRVS